MPRPPATTDDRTAERLLANGWEILRQRLGFGPDEANGAIEVGDIPLFNGIGPSTIVGDDTTGVFYRRWKNREAYLVDLIRYALDQASREGPGNRGKGLVAALASRPRLSDLIEVAARSELDGLDDDPWLGMQLQLWSAARRHGWVRDFLQATYDDTTDDWSSAYDVLIAMYRLSVRPGTDTRRVAVLLTALVYGLVIRQILDPEAVDEDLFPNGVQALVLGILDHDVATSGLSLAEALDAIATAADGSTSSDG